MRRLDAEGEKRKPTDYVFGNAAGEQIKSIKTAWKLACRRAGIVGLHFHDLRREGASSLLESRMSEHAVKDILGHANIKTTSTYLATTRQRLHEQMKRAEAHRAKAAGNDAQHSTEDATNTASILDSWRGF